MTWTNIYYFIITDYDLENVLLQKKKDSYSLINYESNGEDDLHKTIKNLTGLSTSTLYFTDLTVDLENKKETITFVLMSENSNDNKNNFEWFNINNLPENIDQRHLLDNWIKIKDKKFNTPWFNKDWYEESKSYLSNILKNQYKINVISFSQYYVSAISCVLKAETDENASLFCKSVLPEIFKNEPQITKELINLFPNNLPDLIHADNNSGFIITEDFGKNILSKNKNFSDWILVIKKFAQLQIKASKHSEYLLNKGLFDRRLKNMPDIIKNYLEQDKIIYTNQENCITTEQKNKLLNNIDKMKNMYDELSFYNIPETIEHGDLHSGNIAIHNNRIIFYDWSDCAISHPFFSLRSFLWNFFDRDGNAKIYMEEFPNIDNPYEKILNAYLEEWKDFNTSENITKAYNLSKVLVNLSYALQYILLTDSMEEHTKFQYKGHILKGFKKFLEYL